MELDYRNMAKLVDIRKMQIQDVSLEMDRYNEEYVELDKIRNSIAKIILLERQDFEKSKEENLDEV